MWGRLFLGLVLAVALVAGYPYAALIINRVIGTNTVAFTEQDGVQRTLVMGPDAPRPGWLPILPKSLVVQASHWLPSPGREIAGDLALLTHKDTEDIKRFYLDALKAASFDTRDIGYGTLNAPAAAYLGIANMLEGYRSDEDLTITVTTGTLDGLIFPSRTVQIHWQKWDKALLRERAAAAPR
jgi:hypothetical protein